MCKAAASDAAGHAERAAESAAAAADASMRADRCLGDAEVSAHAEVCDLDSRLKGGWIAPDPPVNRKYVFQLMKFGA